MIEPITVTIHPDHLTIELQPVKKLKGLLKEKFFGSIPEDVRQQTVKNHGREYLFLYGSVKDLYSFMWKVTSDFDLLLV